MKKQSQGSRDHSQELREAFAQALSTIRHHQGLTQEHFAGISSRTYLSTLERAMKSPTLEKINSLASVLDTHPLTLLALCFTIRDGINPKDLLTVVKDELKGFCG
jgi:transcriptional regulator with XRE-family HTH domain